MRWQVGQARRAGAAGHATPAWSKLGAMASATALLSRSRVWLEPDSNGNSIASAAACAARCPASATSVLSRCRLPHVLTPPSAAPPPSAQLLRRPHSWRRQPLLLPTALLTATPPFPVLRRRVTALLRTAVAAASSHRCIWVVHGLARIAPCPITALATCSCTRFGRRHCALSHASHHDRLLETVSSVCGTSRLLLENRLKWPKKRHFLAGLRPAPREILWSKKTCLQIYLAPRTADLAVLCTVVCDTVHSCNVHVVD